jgi:hypothetical protein
MAIQGLYRRPGVLQWLAEARTVADGGVELRRSPSAVCADLRDAGAASISSPLTTERQVRPKCIKATHCCSLRAQRSKGAFTFGINGELRINVRSLSGVMTPKKVVRGLNRGICCELPNEKVTGVLIAELG